MKIPGNECVFSETELDWLAGNFELSKRQIDVIRCMGSDIAAEKQIAMELGMGRATVRTHLGRICERLGLDGIDKLEMFVRLVRAVRNES